MSEARWPRGLALYLGAYLVFLYLPMALIPLFSFNAATQASFPLAGFTLDWYAAVAANGRLHDAALNSLLVGLAASGLATTGGVLIAYADVRRRGRLARPISILARLPILIPGVILGVALLILVNLVGLGPSIAAIILGHTAFCLPIAVTVMRARFVAQPASLEEAALDLGAGEWTMFRRIVLPLAAPAIAASLLLCFITSFDEFIVAFFLSGTKVTLPIFIWGQLRFPRELPGVMALGSLILAGSALIVGTAELLRRRGLPGRRAATTTDDPVTS